MAQVLLNGHKKYLHMYIIKDNVCLCVKQASYDNQCMTQVAPITIFFRATKETSSGFIFDDLILVDNNCPISVIHRYLHAGVKNK